MGLRWLSKDSRKVPPEWKGAAPCGEEGVLDVEGLEGTVEVDSCAVNRLMVQITPDLLTGLGIFNFIASLGESGGRSVVHLVDVCQMLPNFLHWPEAQSTTGHQK